jgi:hypothetical protein
LKQKQKDMKNLDETRLKSIRVINNIITLKANVANRCPMSRAELEVELPRLESIKKWAVENNQLTTIQLYLVQKTWGRSLQFQAREVASFFNN